METSNNINPVAIPVAALQQARLNLTGVTVKENSVQFLPDPHMFEVQDLDEEFWNRLQKLRIKASLAAKPTMLPSEELAINKRTKAFLVSMGSSSDKLEVAPVDERTAEALIRSAAAASLQELDKKREAATNVMRKTSVVDYNGTYYLLSTLHTGQPAILAQVQASTGTEAIVEVLNWVEIIWEVLVGLMSLMGIKLKTDISAGKWINRLADIINKNQKIKDILIKLAENGAKLLSAKDLLDLLFALWMEGFTKDCLKEAMLDLVDIGFWAIIWFLAKMGSRFAPGVGQALLLADLGLLVAEIVLKLRNR